MRFLVRWIGNALLLMIVAGALSADGAGTDPMVVSGFWAAMLAVALVAVMHLLIKPIQAALGAMGCLVNLLTVGLFGLVLAFAFWALAFNLVGYFLQPMGDSFTISKPSVGFVAAFWMAVGNWLLNMALGDDDKAKQRAREER